MISYKSIYDETDLNYGNTLGKSDKLFSQFMISKPIPKEGSFILNWLDNRKNKSIRNNNLLNNRL